MPLRALGYVAGAVQVAQHLPDAQVQIVHTLHTARRVNGVNGEQAREGAQRFARLGRLLVHASGVSFDQSRLRFFTDPEDPLAIPPAGVQAAIDAVPENARERLLAGGERRNADTTAYVAAHLQMHDTAAALQPLETGDTAPVTVPERIISIGAQSERPFYLARMAYRAGGAVLPGSVDTAQLFTRHVLPPYFFARGTAEPPMQALHATPQLRAPLEWMPSPFEAQPANASVARDLAYLESFLAQGVPSHA